MDLSTSSIDAMLDAFALSLGSGAMIRIFTGPAPADCSDPDTGYELAVESLSDDFWAPSSGGAKVLSGTWTLTGLANDTPGHFRIYGADYTCRMQGTVSAVGGGGDLQLLAATIEEGGPVTIVALTLTEANL
jgi:hypothetical protein